MEQQKDREYWIAQFSAITDAGVEMYCLTPCPFNINEDGDDAKTFREHAFRQARETFERLAKTRDDTFGPNNTVTLAECVTKQEFDAKNFEFNDDLGGDDLAEFKYFDDALETLSEIASDIKALHPIVKAARNFIFEPENWENYRLLRTSNSAAIPPEFMALGDAVVRLYGPKWIDDHDGAENEIVVGFRE